MRTPDPVFSPAALAAVLFGELRVAPAARFRLALSGGLDSTVLLHALAALRVDLPLSLHAIHIDHGLHPDSGAWARHCADLCARLGVPLESRPVTVTAVADHGPEAAARRARYRALAEMLEPGEVLLTGHQRDDQAETVLLQLLRGTGVAGLAGMAARSAFAHGELVRPLLGFARAALAVYGCEQRLAWIEDPSNRDTRLRRNLVRSEIMPRLRAAWPEAETMLLRTAAHAAEAAALLDELAVSDLDACRLNESDRFSDQALSVARLASLSPARQRNAVRGWLRAQGFLAPGARQLEELLAQLRHTPRSRHACVRWPGAEVWRYRDQLVALPVCASPDPRLDVGWNVEQPLQIPGVGRLVATAVRGQGIARRHVVNGLHVRLRQGGERVRLAGRGQHQALKKLLQAAGVPPWLRPRLPILYAADTVVAIADLWVCDGFAATTGEDAVQVAWEPGLTIDSEPESIR